MDWKLASAIFVITVGAREIGATPREIKRERGHRKWNDQ